MMNKRQRACLDWMYAAGNHTWEYTDLWEAACDYQREEDAKEIEKNSGEEAKACAYLIRRNK